MPSEANKIRQQCQQKAAVREKKLKERITLLETELTRANAKLEDYDAMKRAYVKMLVFCGLKQEERDKLLKSSEVEDKVKKWSTFLGIAGSEKLLELAAEIATGSHTSLDEVFAEVEKRWNS